MGSLFENKFSFTKEIHEEATKKTMSLWYRLRLCAIELGIFTIVVLLINSKKSVFVIIGVVFLLISIYMLYLIIYGYKHVSNVGYKEIIMNNNNKSIDFNIKFYRDRIYLLVNNIQNETYQYKDIKKIIYSNNIDILILKSNSCIIVKKDGFTKGSLDEFESFISSVCTDAKIKGRR